MSTERETQSAQETPTTKKISRNEIESALRRSGYLLESRVHDLLRRRSFYVDANVAYPDPYTGKSRELDLYAMSAERAGPDPLDLLFQVLLIECVNNPQPIAFFTKQPLTELRDIDVDQIKLAGLPVKVPERGTRDSWLSVQDWLNMGQYHHYCQGRVATQFCSFVKKRNQSEWMATHLEEQFDAFHKLCAATEYFRKEYLEGWTLGRNEHVNIEIYYPVLVVQGDLVEVRPRGRSFTTKPLKQVRFRQSISLEAERVEEYSIDVVTEKYLSRFVRITSEEIGKSARLLRRRHREVRRALERIVRAGRRLRSSSKIRELLEF